MSGTGGKRRLPGRRLRPIFEMLLLAVSVVAGVTVVGSCAAAGSGGSGGAVSLVGVVGGVLFAVTLVGAVFLFTTMSRDLRLLRDRYLKDDGARAARQTLHDRFPPGPPDADM
jgi:uncharacterized membrane protein